MSLDANALRKLAALGLNPEQMSGVLDVLASMTEAEEARKASQRERTRKFREKIGAVTLQSHHGNSDMSREGATRGEDKPLPQKIEPQESKKQQDALRDVEAFKAELSPHLNADQLGAILKLRRQKRAVISGHAARVFLAAIARCGISVSDAADKCIERNWISIEPSWLAPQARGSPPPRSNPILESADRLLAEMRAANGPDRTDTRHPARLAIGISGRG